MIKQEFEQHVTERIIPFWKKLHDSEYGGYYGYMSYDLEVDRNAIKGCILNSRILWFFSNAALMLKDESLTSEATHAYEFLRNCCVDSAYGGVYWSVTYDGKPADDQKHTYNQAFAIYALASYYRLTKDEEALSLAFELQRIIENKCRDELGYMEAFTRAFELDSNEKLSENGVMAEKTMNTLLHVFEAYTELYDVSGDEKTGEHLRWILHTFADRVYNPEKKRQEVFFDKEWNTLIDLHSFGHDIETAWLLDRGAAVLGDQSLAEQIMQITFALEEEVYDRAFNGWSLANEMENGIVDTKRVWWVQAETITGFYNAWQKRPEEKRFLEAVERTWEFVKSYVIDKRPESEWFENVYEDGMPMEGLPIVQPWKCPYHNGRMCLEMMKRMED